MTRVKRRRIPTRAGWDFRLSTRYGVWMLSWDEVAQRALRELSEEERREGVAYLDKRELPAGSTLELEGRGVRIARASALVFVDRMPRANWGHSCRYIVVDLESGAVESIEARFPPFLREVPPTLSAISKGGDVPDWAVATP